ncbi:MAG: hypothetical protein WCQ67_03345, partial [Treponema sp.]
PANTAIRFYKKGTYDTALNALNETLNKLGTDGDSESFEWRNTDSAVAVFTMTLSGTEMAGRGVAATLPEDFGIIVFFCWCQKDFLNQCNNFMASTLDSLCIDRGSYYSPGIMTSYLYPATSKKIPVTLEIDGKKINTQLDSNDSDASNFVISREYNLLTLYAQNENWKEAWLRYYRMIFRDSYLRMSRPAFDIYNEIAPACADETDLAQKLLTWTQSFSYDRAKSENESDFTSLPDVLLKKGNDCDSRSMLVSVMLQNMNIDSIIFISAEYSHAICGLVSTHPGQSITVNDKKYLTGETTAKGLTWGMISQDMSDFTKWLAVTYPN